MKGARKNQQGDSCPGRNIQESPGPWGGDRGYCSLNGQRRDGGRGGKGAPSRAAGPEGQHEGTRRGAASPAGKVPKLL